METFYTKKIFSSCNVRNLFYVFSSYSSIISSGSLQIKEIDVVSLIDFPVIFFLPRLDWFLSADLQWASSMLRLNELDGECRTLSTQLIIEFSFSSPVSLSVH